MAPADLLRLVRRARLAAAAIAFACAACAAAADIAGPLPTGIWGGPQGTLVIYADSATLDLPCAAGRIQGPLAIDSTGAFDRSGSYAVVAGPIGINGANWQPARFLGQRSDDTIELRIDVASFSQTVGPLRFRRGLTQQFPRCV